MTRRFVAHPALALGSTLLWGVIELLALFRSRWSDSAVVPVAVSGDVPAGVPEVSHEQGSVPAKARLARRPSGRRGGFRHSRAVSGTDELHVM
jgi:hypothetical protein